MITILVQILQYENVKSLPMDHLKSSLFHLWYMYHSLGALDWLIRVSLNPKIL